ncbi:transcription termination factor Rho [Demequina aurantiaca]|uniref:transcription termination factor Rho n=1 Tax=Demequina aurantiaca TaxID=676200 RepID=UPI003D33A6DD
MKLPQLQALASELGVSGITKLRKSDLVDAIKNGGVVTPKAEAPKTQSSKTQAPKQAAPKADASASETDAKGDEATKPARGRGRTPKKAPVDSVPAAAADNGDAPKAPERSDKGDDADERARRAAEAVATAAIGGKSDAGKSESEGEGQRGRGRSKNGDRNNSDRNNSDRHNSERNNSDRNNSDRNNSDRNNSDRHNNDGGNNDRSQGDNTRGNNNDRNNNRGNNDSMDDERGRRRRGRGRGRNRTEGEGIANAPRDAYDDDDVRDDEELSPVGGIVDVLDSYAFIRTTGYLPGKSDVYVSMNQVRKYGLRKGDAISGTVRPPRPGERGQRQKFNALAHIDKVNGLDPVAAQDRPVFGDLTPLYPQSRLHLETDPRNMTNRVIDLVAPIGKGQRGLIVSPPKAGKTLVLQSIANAITTNNPEVHLMVVLVDERPEEVTDMQRTVKGEVIASTFDRPAEDHTTVAELAIERAKRLVEMGQDVVVLLDSITRLGRAYNISAPASGRILSGGVDSSALYPPKRFFGAARNIEHGGSLTILATALVETGSKADEVIFEEFKGTGNMELKLSRSLADRRVFPAVDVNASGTRREEILMSPEELKVMWKLRRVLTALEQQQAIELLLGKLKENQTNAEFLMQVAKTTPTHEEK